MQREVQRFLRGANTTEPFEEEAVLRRMAKERPTGEEEKCGDDAPPPLTGGKEAKPDPPATRSPALGRSVGPDAASPLGEATRPFEVPLQLVPSKNSWGLLR